MATRTYRSGDRAFVISMMSTPDGSRSVWTIAGVRDAVTRAPVPVPGLPNIVESDEDTAFARACERINAWMRLKP